jgi:hypothetical protein
MEREKVLMKFLLMMCCICFFFGDLCAGDLEAMYKSSKTKDLAAEEFVKEYPQFKWQGENKRIAISKSSVLFKHKVRESIAYFSAKGKLTRLDAWVYNRGDDGDLSQQKYELFYRELIKDLEDYFAAGKPKRKPVDGAVRNEAYLFPVQAKCEVKLQVGYKKRPYRADFLNLILNNHDKRVDRLSGSVVKSFVNKSKDGDILIDRIPMIDQGPKGYCVPATLARIGQHVGVDISMHEIAMIANSSSGGGTSVGAAVASLKKNYARIQLKIKDIRIKNPINAYTSNASVAKQAFDELEYDDRSVASFFKEVKKQIDKGQIIAWSMVVGLLPENGQPARQSGGGHMRMIIGYNEKSREILFSDSWGSGHELKRIDLKAALIVSSGIYQIVP